MAKRKTKTKYSEPPGPEKIKDMVESLLPCKARNRKAAYVAKRVECRKVRRRVRQDLRTCDAEGYTDKNLYLLPCQSMNVVYRRGGDNLGPFFRWAKRRTAGMREREALSYVRKLLPRNVIGDHAYSHWESLIKRRW